MSENEEILLDGEVPLPNSIGYNTSYYRQSFESGFTYVNVFPIQIIFQNNCTILFRDGSILSCPTCVERVGICNLSGSACATSNYIYVNSISGLIYGDSDHLEAAGSP